MRKSEQALSDGLVQVPVLFEQRRPIAPRDLIEVHGSLNHGSIRRAECIENFFQISASGIVIMPS